MNSLIAFLRREGDVTLSRLKEVFRTLSKKTHPDLKGGSGERFIRLRREYEEAVKLIADGIEDTQPAEVRKGDIRTGIFDGLYRYYLKGFCKEGERILLGIIRTVKSWRKDVYDLLRSYHGTFVRTYRQWKDDGDVFYTHGLFMACLMQFEYYRSFRLKRNKFLFEAYRADLEKKSALLEEGQAEILTGLLNWLNEEIRRLPGQGA